jgi:hypothetical protein
LLYEWSWSPWECFHRWSVFACVFAAWVFVSAVCFLASSTCFAVVCVSSLLIVWLSPYFL